MKRIISFSLWGTNPRYTLGAIKNAVLAQELFPDWICRFYVGQSTIRLAPDVIKQLKAYPNVEVIEMPGEGNWTGMFWRFCACSDLGVKYVLSRDCDSRLSERERFAVNEWLNSGKSFHIIRDHPWHKALVMGGLWGARTDELRDMESLVSQYKMEDSYNVDQIFLAEKIFPKIKNDCFVHDQFSGGKRIPLDRKNYEFIGQVFGPDDQTDPKPEEVLREFLRKNYLYKNASIYFRSLKMFVKGKLLE